MQSILGILVVGILTVFTYAIAPYLNAPIMVIALFVGLLCNRLYTVAPLTSGIAFTGKTVLRVGVALLGLRISLGEILDLGLESIVLAFALISITILSTVYVAKLLKCDTTTGVLFGGAVGICGASAALAISSVLPDRHKRLEKNTICAVICVNLLSTTAMILYPLIADKIGGFTPLQTGIFFGLTIHDVAQVVGAGVSVSDEVTNVAVVSKLVRVAFLSFVVVCAALFYRAENKALNVDNGKSPPILPMFLVVFLGFVALNSMHFVPSEIAVPLVKLSKILLVASIIALGMKTQLGQLREVGYKPIILSIFSTIVILVLGYAGVAYFI